METARRLAAAALASSRRVEAVLGHPWVLLCIAAAWVAVTSPAAGQPAFDVSDILDEAEPKAPVELVRTRVTAYSQKGLGYQSQAGPVSGPGSETLTVFQAQAELAARQGENITHHAWVPVDIVTSASANANDRYFAAPDVVSTASAQNYAAEADYSVDVQTDRDSTWTGGVAIHNEEILWSWRMSLGYERALAEDNATLGINVNQILDWFALYELGGERVGRTSRSSTNGNVSLSQLLSPTTIVAASYGATLQEGTLSNGWNTVPTDDGSRVEERLPDTRARHALAGRVSQWLPGSGALHLSYRFYTDSWDVRAHTVEVHWLQPLGPWLTLGATYRNHHQTAVQYFTTSGRPTAPYLTADSDLAELTAQTVGGSIDVDIDARPLGTAFLSFGYDYYFRSNDLRMNIATCASGFHF